MYYCIKTSSICGLCCHPLCCHAIHSQGITTIIILCRWSCRASGPPPQQQQQKKKNKKKKKQPQHQQEAEDQYYQQDQEPASSEAVHLPTLPMFTKSQLQLARLLGEGATGQVFQGLWLGQPAAIKLLSTRGWVPATSFMWEAKVYLRMQQLQGSCVPRLFGHGYANTTSCYFLAMTLAQGTPLDQLPQPLAPEVRAAAMRTLQQVHSLGVLHGDIRLDHLLLQQQDDESAAAEGRPLVILIDFGRASIDAPTEALLEEQQELQQLLAGR
jgi:serine/threonine protein kinase